METFNFILQRDALHAAFIASAEARFRAIVALYPTIPPTLAAEPAPPAVTESTKPLHDAAKFPTIIKLVSGAGAEYVELKCPTCHANACEKTFRSRRKQKTKLFYLGGVGGIINHMREVHGTAMSSRELLEEMAARARRLALEDIVAINSGAKEIEMVLGDVSSAEKIGVEGMSRTKKPQTKEMLGDMGSAEKVEVEEAAQETKMQGMAEVRASGLDPTVRPFEYLGQSRHVVPSAGTEQANEGGDSMEME
ncbi:uncharacterized protein BDZ99DRAFT_466634 [Mytilinidion resinicola]|uniref:Uncharacterized protein n=1 Tax=Mytilinidion resinicola TaxID=574789 RepID=A0A6A6YA44_9PEZI|nr:uncharacterized protein BDZ99DRAFT_466634 [Mytilinidion resinicola]KAF2805691.1 hypothetical protein BDZ99DRAFT_466634 [Mytilinidion resinicola]